MSDDVEKLKALVDELANKGVAYVVGLYPYLFSSPNCKHDVHRNVIKTLEPAFGHDIAEEVYKIINYFFRKLGISEEASRAFLINYITKNYQRMIIDEASKRFAQMSEDASQLPLSGDYESIYGVDYEKEVLSLTSAIITSYMNEENGYPGFLVKRDEFGFIKVCCSEHVSLSGLVEATGCALPSPWFESELFYRFLLGFQADSSHEYYDHVLMIYPFMLRRIEELALEVSKYVKVFSMTEAKSKLDELYQRGEFLKLMVVGNALSTPDYESEFLSLFAGLPYATLRKSIEIEGVLENGFINPLVYSHVKEVMQELRGKALEKTMRMFQEAFDEGSYKLETLSHSSPIHITLNSDGRVERVYVKGGERVYLVFLPPFSSISNIFFDMICAEAEKEEAGAVKATVIFGIPARSILHLDSLRYLGSKGFLVLFTDGERLIAISDTYSHNHYGLLSVLGKKFLIEFMGTTPIPRELEELLESIKAHNVVAEVYERERFLSLKPSREVLESIVAEALRDFGFNVKTNAKLLAKGGEVEADVWALKNIGDSQFRVYVSCKNWSKDVDRQVVDQEFGRILQLHQVPHLRVLVVKGMSEGARKAALDDGFFVIELGEKAMAENAQEIYYIVHERLKKLFTGIVPDKVMKTIKKLEKATEDLKSAMEDLRGLI
jgi:predicted RecB family endonuclease